MRRIALLLLLTFCAAGASWAADEAVVYLSGDDTVPEGSRLKAGDVVATTGGMTLYLPDGSSVELAEKTQVRLTALGKSNAVSATKIVLLKGSVRATVSPLKKRGSTWQISTPVAVAGVRGTDFAVSYEGTDEDGSVDIDVVEGEVEVEQGARRERFRAGNGVSASKKDFLKRKVREEMQERWESRREELIQKFKNRFKLADGDLKPQLKELLEKLPPEARQNIKDKLHEKLKAAHNRVQARRKTVHDNRDDRREKFQHKHPNYYPRPGKRR